MPSKTPQKVISSKEWERWQTHAPHCSWNCSCGTAQTWWWIFKAAETTGPDEWHREQKRDLHTTYKKKKRKEKELQVYHISIVSDSFWFQKANTFPKHKCSIIKAFPQKFPQLAEPNIVWSSSIKHHNIYLSLQMWFWPLTSKTDVIQGFQYSNEASSQANSSQRQCCLCSVCCNLLLCIISVMQTPHASFNTHTHTHQPLHQKQELHPFNW